jgi:hypothetical protein
MLKQHDNNGRVSFRPMMRPGDIRHNYEKYPLGVIDFIIATRRVNLLGGWSYAAISTNTST